MKGSNPIHYHAVRGVGDALPRTSRIGGVRAAEQCADGPRGVPPPRHRRRGCRVRPRALSSASTRTLWRARRDCGRTAASYSQRPDGERSIAEPSGGAAVAGRGKLAQLPLDTRGGPRARPFQPNARPAACDASCSRRQCASIFDIALRASFLASRLVANDSGDRR